MRTLRETGGKIEEVLDIAVREVSDAAGELSEAVQPGGSG